MADDGNVKVFCRVRPPNEREGGASAFAKKCVTVPTADPLQQTVLLQLKGVQAAPKTFTFDRVFHELSSQNEVFELVGVPITRACLQGYNGTIFAYGQTGSGKTFTMQGPDDVIDADARNLSEPERALRGLVPRVLDFLFQDAHPLRVATDATRVEHTFACSFMEIYNERVYDLLDHGSTRDAAGLILRENGRKGVSVEGLIESVVSNARQAAELMAIGARNRRVGQTAMNRESSRSHSVFVLQIQSKETTPDGITRTRLSRFNLVDLAGSERQRNTEAAGERLKEAGSINKSLSALGNVIMGLVEQSAGKNRHVHYRDSKLTFLLKDSLGGNSKTFMIATVSPAEDSSHETLSTLKFAQRAKLIRNNAVINEDTTGSVIVLQEEILRLRRQLQEAQAGRVSGHDLAAEVRLSGVNQSPPSEANANVCESGVEERLTELETALAFSLEKNETLMRKNGQLSLQAGHLQSLCEELKRNVSHLKLHLRLKRQGRNAEVDEYESTADAIEWRMKYEELEEAFAELQEQMNSGQAFAAENRGSDVDKLNIMYMTLTKQLAQVIRDKHEISDRLSMKQMTHGDAFEDKIALLESEFMARAAEYESQLNTLSAISFAAEEKAKVASLELLHSKQKEAAWKIDQQRSEIMISELQDQISRLEAEARKAHDMILDEKRNRVDLEIALRGDHLREKEDIEARLAEKLTDYFEMKQSRDDIQVKMNAAISERDELKSEFHELQAELAVRSDELAAALANVDSREDELRRMSAEHAAYQLEQKEESEALQARLDSASSTISHLELSNGNLERSIADLDNEKGSLQSTIIKLESQLNDKDKVIEELRIEDQRSSTLISSLEDSCTTLRAELSDSARISTEKSARIEELLSELAGSASANLALSEKLNSTENTLDKAQGQIESLELEQQQLLAKVDSLERTIADTKRARDDLADRLLRKTDEVSVLTEVNSKLVAQVEESHLKCEKEVESHIKTKAVLDKTSAALEQAEAEQAELKNEINTLQRENAQLNATVDSLTEELAKKSELLQITEETVRECRLEMAERAKKYEAELEISEEKYSNLATQLDATIHKNEQFIATLRSQHADDLQSLQNKAEEVALLHKTQVTELNQEIEDGKLRLRDAEQQHRECVSGLQQEIQSLRTDLNCEKQNRADDAKRAQDRLDELVQDYESKLSSLAATSDQLKKDYESKIDSLNCALDSAKNKINELDSAIKHLETVRTTLEGRVSSLEATKEGLEETIQKLQGERDGLIGRVRSLECDLAQVTSAKAAADDQIDKLTQELKSQIDLVHQRDNEINALESTVNDLKTNLEILTDEHSTIVEELKQSGILVEELKRSHEETMSETRNAHATEIHRLTKDAEASTQRLERILSSLREESSAKGLEIDRLGEVIQSREIVIAQLEGRVSDELRAKECALSDLSSARTSLEERDQTILEKDETIARVQQQLESHQEEANEVKVQLSGRVQLLEADLNDLSRAHDLLTTSNDSLSKQYGETVSELEHARAQNDDFVKQNQELGRRLDETKSDFASLMTTSGELKKELTMKAAEIAAILGEKRRLEDNVTELKKLITQREEEIDEKDSVISGMEETIENLEADKLSASKDLERIAQAEEAARIKLQKFESELDMKTKELASTQEAHKMAENLYREAMTKSEVLVSSLRDEIKRASNDLDAANTVIKQKDNELGDYAGTVEKLRSEIKHLTANCDDLAKQIRQNEELRVSLEVENKEREKSWEQAMNEIAVALADSKSRCELSEKLATTKCNELADCMTALKAAQCEVAAALNTIASLEEKSAAQLASSQEAQEILRKRISELDKDIDDLRADSKKKTVEAAEVEKCLQQELIEVRHELDHSSEKLARQRKRNDSLQELNGQLTRELEEKSTTISSNAELLHHIKVELQSARDEKLLAQEQLATTMQTLSTLTVEMEELSKAHKQLATEVEQKMERLKAKELEWEAKEMELKGRTSVVGEMEEQIADESKRLAEEKVLVAQRKKEADRIKREYDQLKVRVEDLETTKIQLTKEREKYRKEVNVLTHRLDEISKENDKLVGHDNKRQKIQHHIKVKEENNRLQEEVRLLTEQKFKLEVRIEKLELSLKEKENIVNEAQIDLSRSPSSVKSNSSLRGNQHTLSSTTLSSGKQKTDTQPVESSVRKRLRSRNE